jgi:hypothetical protein
MAFIPKDATWYIAQVVLELIVENESRNVIHINYLLVKASSPDDAYEKALRLGHEHESEYVNSGNQRVKIFFRGLKNLDIVYDHLEHGAELLFEERVGVDEKDLAALTQPKERLSVFQPIEGSRGPDYGSQSVRLEAIKMTSRR